jgi:hypothetical protein
MRGGRGEGASLVLLEVEKRNEDEGVVFGDEAGAGLEGDVAEDVEERDLVEVEGDGGWAIVVCYGVGKGGEVWEGLFGVSGG